MIICKWPQLKRLKTDITVGRIGQFEFNNFLLDSKSQENVVYCIVEDLNLSQVGGCQKTSS